MKIKLRKGWTITTLTVGCIGGLIGFAVGNDDNETPESCSAAFSHAEEAMDLYYGALQSAGEGIAGAYSRDPDVVTIATKEITRYSELLKEELPLYYDLKGQCLDGE